MNTALELTEVRKQYGLLKVLQGVNLSIAASERHCIIGPNGAGKSTLFHVISGRQPLSGGRITLGQKKISGLVPHEIARLGLARSFQISNLFPRLSVLENLRCGCMWSSGDRYSIWRNIAKSHAANRRAQELLEEIELQARADTLAENLSYAEQRALEIGIAVAGNPSVLLLDEPTAGMSQAETERAIGLIRRVSEGRALVMVEHDMSVVFGLADRITVLVAGKVLCTGTPEAVRDNAAVREAYLGDLGQDHA
ncbi:ABC transporter ATP-binding protein [Caenimonas soli]|uniref:ABC transporter ATP-binding protein n=1 Tax=Caenimonas soli TaxID=2735555 RepID=UPI001555A26E|nr:ABC transporter ATP-binding protein [Caenimonas soli]NPC55623.1 ABC transporter ATP-binding protein [Caenimonas soli]